MIQQIEFSLREKRRGFHLVTGEILQHLPQSLPETELQNLFQLYGMFRESGEPPALYTYSWFTQ